MTQHLSGQLHIALRVFHQCCRQYMPEAMWTYMKTIFL
ncbi:hypothetical protein ACZ87_03473 [Candidatus Erwinia dacicola]|uniref:Uncharacterized protein n=1 Tax=Candidatus Erwinia dacicola TaxID=252393 RepID=A0A328TPG3_9GAMM|nr:hypothetical protein ACZ87_03473 [Candidatus Erwinia dacicola]